MNMNYYVLTAYENLANAIIQQAVIDYRRALSLKHDDQVQSLERFFKSEWYNVLSNVPGEYIINRIK